MPYHFPILLVDDDPAIADVLNRAAGSCFTEASFHHVDSYVDAVAYLENLDGKGPKLVLLDINLHSQGEGLAFLARLRTHPQGRLVPIIILSATESPQQLQTAYDLGASAFTPKPFDYAGWKEYVKMLRTYWYETVTVPGLWFQREKPNEPASP